MVIIRNANFIAGANNPDAIPAINLPEIAFAGRSNVGKSSLINSIVMRKNLAQISSNPGKTKQINFFNVENVWCLVDMPGYGYAAVSKDSRHKWSEMSKDYFLTRPNLKLICLLIDSRHDPLDSDIAMMEWLENNSRNYLVILTKCDKISKTAIQERKQQIEGLLQLCKSNIEVLPYSSESNNLGRNELIAIIKRFVAG